MTKLEKFLKQSAIETKNSTTTLSRYFRIGYVTIRLSDHVSNKSNSDIQIIIPTNKQKRGFIYSTFLENSGKVLIFGISNKFKEFLPSLLLMKEMNTQSTFKADPSSFQNSLTKVQNYYGKTLQKLRILQFFDKNNQN